MIKIITEDGEIFTSRDQLIAKSDYCRALLTGNFKGLDFLNIWSEVETGPEENDWCCVREFRVISENGTDEIYFTCITTALLKKILIDDQISKNEVATFLHFADKYMFKASFGKE